MSDDQLDNDLRDRIKQVFDNYQDDTAEEGWLLLREKYPEEEKNRAIFWWRLVGAAAVILLALNIFLWYKDDSSYKTKIAAIHKMQRIDSIAMGSTGSTGVKSLKQDSYIQATGQSNSNVSKSTIALVKQIPVNGNPVRPVYTNHYTITKTKNNSVAVSTDSELQPTSTVPLIADNKTVAVADTVKPKTQSTAIVPFVTQKENEVANQQQPVAVSKAMQQLFDKEDKSAKKNTQLQQTAANKFALGIYAASYVNYAKGSQRQFNNGGGISSDIRLTDNLSISTGIAIGQNTLAYNGNSPSPLPVALTAANSRNFRPTASVLPIIVPTSTNLNANLVNLDIPVNLKYNFNPQTGNTYFAAGLSSGTFINESYSTVYNYNVPGNGGSFQQSQDAGHKSFDNFYFAQMLNVAFGLGYPLGKNQIVIEPFFKYPLNGLGDQHILFGSGGINLKFNFESGKSK